MRQAILPAFLIVLSVLRVELMGHEDDSMSELVSRTTPSIEDAHAFNLICSRATCSIWTLWQIYDLLGFINGINWLSYVPNLDSRGTRVVDLVHITMQTIQWIRFLYVAVTCDVFYLTRVAAMTFPLGLLSVVIDDLCKGRRTSWLKIWFRFDRTLLGLTQVFLAWLPVIILNGMMLQNGLDAYLGETWAAERRDQAMFLKEYRWQRYLEREAEMAARYRG